MKRYFEVTGRQQTLMLNVSPPLTTASVNEISELVKLPLREIFIPSEYNKLKKLYSIGDKSPK